MNKAKKRWNPILLNETIVFSLLIVLSWLTELLRIPHYLFGETFTPNWHRATLRSAILLIIWAWIYGITKKLLKRMHYLQEFLRTCSWCRKICHDNEWKTVDEYFKSELAMKTTHGMCPDCLTKWEKDFEQTMDANLAADSATRANADQSCKPASDKVQPLTQPPPDTLAVPPEMTGHIAWSKCGCPK